MRTRKRIRGFTLVELLIVIMIVGVLMAIFVPALGKATRRVRMMMTQGLMRDLELGLKAFYRDFGDYPPSQLDKNRYPRTGAEKLVYYVRGPVGTGWGIAGGGRMPFDEQAKPTRTYGPYFQADDEQMSIETVPSESRPKPVAFLDYFSPPGRILYFKPRVNSKHKWRYYFEDNNLSGNQNTGDPAGRTNFAKDEYFNDCIVSAAGEGEDFDPDNIRPEDKIQYHRSDYLLMSPGPDGRFGTVGKDAEGEIHLILRSPDNPARYEEISYDDVTNWNY